MKIDQQIGNIDRCMTRLKEMISRLKSAPYTCTDIRETLRIIRINLDRRQFLLKRVV